MPGRARLPVPSNRTKVPLADVGLDHRRGAVRQPGGAVEEYEQGPRIDTTAPEVGRHVEGHVPGVGHGEHQPPMVDGHTDVDHSGGPGRLRGQLGQPDDPVQAVVEEQSLESGPRVGKAVGAELHGHGGPRTVHRDRPGTEAVPAEALDQSVGSHVQCRKVPAIRGAGQDVQPVGAELGPTRPVAVGQQHGIDPVGQCSEPLGQGPDGQRGDPRHRDAGTGEVDEQPRRAQGQRRTATPQQDPLEPPIEPGRQVVRADGS